MSKDVTLFLKTKVAASDEKQLTKHIKHNLEITTETDLIYLPIEAEIYAGDEFSKIFKGNYEAGKNKSVKILSVGLENTQ
jgi:hypothetical protein